jgi:hypothetical protein
MKTLTTFACFLAVLFFAACDLESGDGKGFDYDLQGTWVSADEYPIYSGSLTIEYDRITITGYNERQTPIINGNDHQRPFRNFVKGVALKGYSNEGKIYIEDAGTMQEGIPYTYWEDSFPDYTRLQRLRFTFDGRVETLIRQY